MKKLLTVLITCSLLLTGCGVKPSAVPPASTTTGSAVTLRLSHDGPITHYYQTAGLKFADLVSQKTSGQVTVEVYPANSLAASRESVEGAQMGTIDMVLASTMVLSGFEKKIDVLNLPFLFTSREQAYKVLDGPIGDEMSKMLEAKKLVVLAWWENGFRNITNNKRPINTPADMKGLKIRVPESSIFIDTFTALGALPTPISFGELYSALQLGTVDAQENPLALIVTSKFNEVQKYCSLTEHIYSADPIIISKMVWDKLTADQQKAVKEAAVEVKDYERDLSKKSDDEYLKELMDSGVEVVQHPDLAAFQEAVKPIYGKYEGGDYGDLLSKILDAVK